MSLSLYEIKEPLIAFFYQATIGNYQYKAAFLRALPSMAIEIFGTRQPG